MGRFINTDSYASTDVTGLLSTNMFAYCENDPVNRSDPSGEIWATIAKMAVGATISAATYTVGAIISGVSSHFQSYRSGNDLKTALPMEK